VSTIGQPFSLLQLVAIGSMMQVMAVVAYIHDHARINTELALYALNFFKCLRYAAADFNLDAWNFKTL
jgi:hypothetical protein